MTANFSDLLGLEFTLDNINVYYQIWPKGAVIDYERHGRTKNLIYYQIDGKRNYYRSGKLLFTVKKGDLLFISDKTPYYTDVPDEADNSVSSGVGVSFFLTDKDGNNIDIDEPIQAVNTESEKTYSFFKKIQYAFLHRQTQELKLRGQFYLLLDYTVECFLCPDKDTYSDIKPAIKVIERTPEKSYTNAELAEMCFISESTFIRRFKKYSGGITPNKYRLNILINMAKELTNSSKTISEIASLLGFYDASHLSRIYKAERGETLKKH